MTRIRWEDWGVSPFSRARLEKKAVLLRVESKVFDSSRQWAESFERPEVISAAADLVCVRVDADDRPGIAARYGLGAAILSADGEVMGRIAEDGAAALALALSTARAQPQQARASEAAAPVWTGAVGPKDTDPELDFSWPLQALPGVLAMKPEAWPCIDCLEFLLYASCEWKDGPALKSLVAALSGLAEGPLWDRKSGGFSPARAQKSLAPNARLARLYWDAFSLTRNELFSRTASQTVGWMTRELFDPARGAFLNVRASESGNRMYADGNAIAALALFKASAFENDKKHLEAANHILVFLTQLFDPRRGLAHFWDDGRASVYGLLGDQAWSCLAFTEAFLMAGNKPHREFADVLLRNLFQENWQRDHGGFLDRVPSPDDFGALKQPRLPVDLNAVAFEAAWRLNELKGNANYRRWVEWGLKHLVPRSKGDACLAAPLARVMDMVRKGRVDLELVGRIGDGRTDGFLTALHQHYLPRKIISFVDPDDQDYLMAHKLQADTYPRLFGCVQLRPKINVDRPEDVPKLLESLAGI